MAVLVAASVPVSAGANGAYPSGETVVDVPVRFRVENTNRSAVSCPSDNQPYEVQGHLVGPDAELQHGSSVTIYLHGGYTGESLWHFDMVPAYDHTHEMALAGHVSVTIDLLGYGRSGLPDGRFTCFGSDADVTHQIVDYLRTGTYDAGGRAAPHFARVGLVGLSAGGYRSIAEAASFGDVDALAVIGAANSYNGTPAAADTILRASAVQDCPLGLKTKAATGPLGYYDPNAEANVANLFFAADPAVIRAFVASEEREPCAQILFGPTFLAGLQQLQSRIRMPVLVLFGDHDALWTDHVDEKEAVNYSSSIDVTHGVIPDAGHLVMLERQAPEFRRVLSQWLLSHGL